MGRRCNALALCLQAMFAAVVLQPATGFRSSLQQASAPGGSSGGWLQRARDMDRCASNGSSRWSCAKGSPRWSCTARESGEEKGDDGSFTGGDDLAIRMMISRNRSQRDAEERVYVPLDVAVRWARMTRAWTSTPSSNTLDTPLPLDAPLEHQVILPLDAPQST